MARFWRSAAVAVLSLFWAAGAAWAQSTPATARPDYRINPLDVLAVDVYQVERLSVQSVQVDASGRIFLPLVGSVEAAGKTVTVLSDDIAQALSRDYLQNPRVAVRVVQAAPSKVTVDGAVVSAGVFEIKGRTTLLQAVAMAKGPSKTANLRRVVVFREVEGRMTPTFYDLRAIRKGEAPDPEIFNEDIVVVQESRGQTVFRETLAVVPLLSIFRWL